MIENDAVVTLIETAQKAKEVEVKEFRPAVEPSDVYFLYDTKNGIPVKHTAEPHPQAIAVLGTQDLADFAGADGTIYYNDKTNSAAATKPVVSGDVTRRAKATLALPFQSAFATLTQIHGKTFSQREFWNLLRTTFLNAVSADFVAAVKNVKWSAAGADETSLSVGKESLGRNIVAELSGNGASFPESVTLRVGVWDVLEFRDDKYEVLCAVDTNHVEKTFRLIPVENAVARARERATIDLRTALEGAKAEGALLVYGNPTN